MLILGRDQRRTRRSATPAPSSARSRTASVSRWSGGCGSSATPVACNPAGLAERLREIARGLGLDPAIAHVEGDDLRAAGPLAGKARSPPTPTSAASASPPRCARAPTSSSPVASPTPPWSSVAAVAHHGWSPTAYDELAGAVVAGHVLECGCQATGGNFSGFLDLDRSRPLGLPGRRDRRRRVERDHQARRHRRRGHRRHRHRAAGLRDPVDALPRARRHHPSRHDPARAGRPRPGRDHRHARRGAAATAQGLRQRARRLPQLRRVPAHRPATSRRRRTGSAPSSSGRWASARRPRRSSGTSHTPGDPDATRGPGHEHLPLRAVRDPSPDGRRQGADRRRRRARAGVVPRLHPHRPPTPATPYGIYRPAYVDRADVTHTVVHADGRREVVPDPPAPRRRDRCRRSETVPVPRSAGRPHPPAAARHVRARAVRRQGRRRQRRAVGGARRPESPTTPASPGCPR